MTAQTASADPEVLAPSPADGDDGGAVAAARGQAVPHRRGRPLLLMAVWIVVLAVLAALAPLVQLATGIPWSLLALVMLAPAVAALIVRLTLPRWRAAPWAAVPWRRVLAPAAIALVYVAVIVGVLAAVTGKAPSLPLEVAGVPITVFLVVQLVGALGEEIGWRGEMQRAAEEVLPSWPATLAVATLFGATHLSYWPYGPAFVAAFTCSSVLLAAAMRWLWRGSLWQRLVPAAIIHTGTNLSFVAVPAAMESAELWMIPLPAAIGLAAVIPLALLLRRHESRSAREAGAPAA